jgi:hypothetical protein
MSKCECLSDVVHLLFPEESYQIPCTDEGTDYEILGGVGVLHLGMCEAHANRLAQDKPHWTIRPYRYVRS